MIEYTNVPEEKDRPKPPQESIDYLRSVDTQLASVRTFLDGVQKNFGLRLTKPLRFKHSVEHQTLCPSDGAVAQALGFNTEELKLHRKRVEDYEQAVRHFDESKKRSYSIFPVYGEREYHYTDDAENLFDTYLNGKHPSEDRFIVAIHEEDGVSEVIGALSYGLRDIGARLPFWSFSFVVEEEWRRLGIASRMVEVFLGIREMSGAQGVEVRVWAYNKEHTPPLLEKLGFDFDGEHHCTYFD